MARPRARKIHLTRHQLMTTGATHRRIDKLIHLLVKNATVVVPGPKIAAEIGVTRSTVWVWIKKLRSLGVEIKGHPSSGYQLQKLPDILAPSLLRPELGDCELGRKIIHYFRTESTNDDALKLSVKEAPHGTLILAEEQTAGRGRFGRSWYSERSSGIYCSIILRPQLPPAAASVVTLMAGVAAHHAVVTATQLAVDIRWPNDLLVNGKKICGILTEMSAELDRLHGLVLGIGINVNHRELPADLKRTATSLRIEGGRTYSRVQILVSLLKELERYYRLLLEKGSAAIVAEWAACSTYSRGKQIRVVTGSRQYLATTQGVEPNGALRVRREDGGEESLLAGEVMEVK